MTEAIYVRTSTSKQDLTSQLAICREKAGPDALVFQDAALSGKRDDRAGIIALLDAAREGKISRVYVAELSRIGRSLGFTVRVVEELHALGVSVILAKTGTEINPSTLEGKAMLGALALAADIEHSLILERNQRGRIRMAEKGIRGGRRPKAISTEAIRALAAQGHSAGRIAREMGVSKATIIRRFKSMGLRHEKGRYVSEIRTDAEMPNCETPRVSNGPNVTHG
ncbi:MAG: recombinase family protein [Thermoplasmata archaeon]